MNHQSPQLPWEELRRPADEIPWGALSAFADAVTTDAGVADGLFQAYDEVWRSPPQEAHYVDLYVPAIFAMAAPKLSDEQRKRIGELLIQRLVQAGREGADLTTEALVAASGTMGPVVLPAVLDAIEQEHEFTGAWFDLWHLAELAAEAEDTEVRERVVQVSVAVLDKVDRNEVEDDVGMGAAWAVAALGRSEYIGLLERLSRKCPPIMGGADYREAANSLRRNCPPAGYTRIWEQPVREWLESTWKYAKDWFDKRSQPPAEREPLPERGPAAWPADIAPAPEPPFAPPIPIINQSPKVGRNDPCPCGSGKKYKKCCGRTAQDHAETTL